MNTAPPRDQPSRGIKSAWSIKHKVDRSNILKAIFMIRNTVKYSHENILNQAKLNSSTNKLNKSQWGQVTKGYLMYTINFYICSFSSYQMSDYFSLLTCILFRTNIMSSRIEKSLVCGKHCLRGSFQDFGFFFTQCEIVQSSNNFLWNLSIIEIVIFFHISTNKSRSIVYIVMRFIFLLENPQPFLVYRFFFPTNIYVQQSKTFKQTVNLQTGAGN